MLLRTVKFLLYISPLFAAVNASRAYAMTAEEYIAAHKNDAVRDMIKTGVPASITLAQALLESEDGNSSLAREANNHFGIKCTSDWTGPSYTKNDDRKDECFRKYKCVLDSYDDHSYFLRSRPRYAALFELPKTDYKRWAKGLKQSGYATNPRYADQLIKIIEDYQLYKLDNDAPDNLYASASNTTDKEAASSDKNAEAGLKPVATPKEESHILTDKPKAIPHKINSSNTVDPFSEYRVVMKNNGVPYIIAKHGDTYDKIAKEYEMMPWLIYKYNEVSKGAALEEGQMVYIKPKHRSTDQDTYIVKEGDTVQSISQQFGIKMKMINKRNDIEKGTEVKVGQKLWLNKKKPS